MITPLFVVCKFYINKSFCKKEQKYGILLPFYLEDIISNRIFAPCFS